MTRRLFHYDPKIGKVVEIERSQVSNEGQSIGADFTPFFSEALGCRINTRSELRQEMKRQKVVDIMDSRKSKYAVGEKVASVMARNKNPDFLKKGDRFLKSIR